MNYFKINYDKLKNIKEKQYFIIIIIILFIFLYLIMLSFFIKVKSSYKCYGIISDNLLKININMKLSDKINKNNKLKFKDTYTTYKIKNYLDYEVIDNEIFQIIELELDDYFHDNEVGEVTIYYDDTILIKYILDLFK